jgi:hypothetical protein
MNGSCESPSPQLCGCCAGVGPETPQPISNRPGLSTIAYRVSTHPTFKASMLAALSNPAFGLGTLRTRDDADFSIALLDAWASASDILTFYQERLANEAYLRTAVQQRSVMELARLVGYRPSSGVAASTFLAFTLSTAPGAPATVLIPAGSRVQSVPGPGQTPQMFETSSDIVAQVSENAIPAQTTVPVAFSPGDTSMWIAGTANQLNVGDLLIFIGSGFRTFDPANSGQWDFHHVTSVATDPTSGNTHVTWEGGLASWFPTGDTSVQVYAARKKAALFGAQAPDPRTLPTSATSNVTGGAPLSVCGDWNFQYAGNRRVNLDASYSGIAVPSGGTVQWAVLMSPDGLWAPFQVTAAQDTSPLAYTLTTKTTQLTLADEPWLDPSGNVLVPTDTILAFFVEDTRDVTAYVQTDPLEPAGPPLLPWSYDGTYTRRAGVLSPVAGGSLAIVGGQEIAKNQPVGVSGARLGLRVTTGAQAAFVPAGVSGTLAVADGDTFAVDAFPPAPGSTLSPGAEIWQVITTSGIAGALHVAPQNLAIVPAAKGAPVVGEAAVVTAVEVAGSITTLGFAGPLARLYDRATVKVNANAVAATDGQTTHEILGSGDATDSALSFTLKQSPLTYVAAANSQGAQSTLQVWVNNLEWQEVPNFLASGPTDRVYVTRADASGKVTVQFGDGGQGARTPTGQMNITAAYRTGIGAASNVAAGQLSQAIDRPQGLTGATNPSGATGGADPDSADAARVSAPLHVLTLDRVVSLVDYQNFAQAFGGIAKALATWTWFGRTRGVYLTVAGAAGATFQAGDPTIVKLAVALRAAGNPYVPLVIASYVPTLFEVGANVLVASDYDPTQVLADAWQALSQAFSFDRRALGQGVAQSDVVATIQAVPGVTALEMTAFSPSGQAAPASGLLPPVIQPASPITSGSGTPQAAQLLLLDPASQGAFKVWTT